MSNFSHDKTIILFESTFSSTKNIYNLFKYNFNSKKSDRHEIPRSFLLPRDGSAYFSFRLRRSGRVSWYLIITRGWRFLSKRRRSGFYLASLEAGSRPATRPENPLFRHLSAPVYHQLRRGSRVNALHKKFSLQSCGCFLSKIPLFVFFARLSLVSRMAHGNRVCFPARRGW